jgi:hypothetical protein
MNLTLHIVNVFHMWVLPIIKNKTKVILNLNIHMILKFMQCKLFYVLHNLIE